MFGITLAHLNGRLARRLFLVLVTSAVLPLALASLIVYLQLDSLAGQRKADQLLDAAKTTGMAALGELNVASIALESQADRLHEWHTAGGSAIAENGARGTAAALFSSMESLPAGDLPMYLRDRGLPALNAAQVSSLRNGKSVLLWTAAARPPAHFYLLRMDSSGDHAALGRLRWERIWSSELDLPRSALLSLSDGAGRVLYTFNNGVALQAGVMPVAPLAMDSRTLQEWTERDTVWQGIGWDLFLQASFAAEPLRVVLIEPATSISTDVGSLGTILPAVLALALLLGVWLAVTQIRRYLDPLLRLTAGTKRLAARQFSEPIEINTGDELAELGEAFNAMAGSLQSQFVALESMAQIDRLLLRSPDLEQVLDALLRRIAAVTGCQVVSVTIVDPDAPEHARSYELSPDPEGTLPVRRVGFREAALREVPLGRRLDIADHPALNSLGLLEPLRLAQCVAVELWPLQHRETLLGALCLGFRPIPAELSVSTGAAYGQDFADRLTVALTNLRHEERLYRQANFDPVTGLANRHLLRERIAAAVAASASAARGALFYIDLDNFKQVNDSAGHSTGDELLQIIGRRLVASATDCDTVARLGGDEFVLLAPAAVDPDSALAMARRLIECIAREVDIAGGKYFVSASVGIVLLGRDGTSVEELLRNGDIAMYRAKESGRGKAVFFAAAMHDRMRSRSRMESGIRTALAERAFEVYYQPIHDQGGLIAAEALLRWRDGSGKMVAPATFIPVAEETGLIVELGGYLIEVVCQHLAAWLQQGCAPRYVAVNVSPRQLRASGFVERFVKTIREQGLPSSALQVEITESIVAEGPEALAALHALAGAGISIALDDFGTGYSSLSYLRTFPIDVVKIDRSFITDLPDNSAACQLVETIIGMAHGLGKKVVAEGVETAAQKEFLLRHDCDRVQGYYLGRPLPAPEFNRLLTAAAEANPDCEAVA